METPRKFIIAELSIRKLGFSSVLIILLLLALSIFTFSKSLATFTLHGSRYPVLKTIYYFLIGITIPPDSFLATGILLI